MIQKIYSGERLVGTLEASGQDVFLKYDSSWMETGFPLSIKLPFTSEPKKMSAGTFLKNLFPEAKRKDFITKFKRVSPNMIIPFLQLYGDDLPGAINIRPSDKYTGEKDITSFIAKIVEENLSLDLVGGRISLAGADPKTGVIAKKINGQYHFFAKTGTSLSTHILKATRLLAESEAIGMEVARLSGLNVCESELVSLNGNPVYLVKRYDRENINGEIIKIQQEDFCQHLGLSEDDKYFTDENGKIASDANQKMASVVFSLSNEDKISFLRSSIFNIIFGNTDDHAKNYSLLYKNGKWKLAPLYDIISLRILRNISPFWKDLSTKTTRPFGYRFVPGKITYRDFELHSEIFDINKKFLVELWIDTCEKTINSLNGFGDYFLSNCVPDGINDNRLKTIRKFAQETEKSGGKFAHAMLDIGVRARPNFFSAATALKSKALRL